MPTITEPLVLGIDGGGTKTHALIADQKGRPLGVGLGGPSNYDDVGSQVAQAGIARAVQQACHMAGVEPGRPFAQVFLGMAGVVSEQDRNVIRSMALNLQLAKPEDIEVDHDCRIALAGGLAGRPGIVQIAGTGSSTYGRTASGENWRSGGWGYLVSDEGSSYFYGVQAMRSAILAYDGRGGPTPLVEKVLKALGLTDMQEIMHRIYAQGLSRSEIAALAPLVVKSAREGDGISQALIEKGSEDLADCVLAVARKLGMTDGICEVALVGGLLNAGEIIIRPLCEAIAKRLPNSRVQLAELSPVDGACVLALQRLGVQVDETVVSALKSR